MRKPEIPADRVRELLNYEPSTGVLTWRVGRGNGVSAGEPAGYVGRSGYRRIGMSKYRHVAAHRAAWLLHTGNWPPGEVDHINGMPDDNRIVNLRVVDRAGNMQNQRRAPANNRAGFLGVKVRPSGFEARIKRGGVSQYLGIFRSPEAAHAAYVEAKRRLHKGNTL